MNLTFSHIPQVDNHTDVRILLTFSDTVHLDDTHKMALLSEILKILKAKENVKVKSESHNADCSCIKYFLRQINFSMGQRNLE